MKLFHLFTGMIVLGIMAASCSSHDNPKSNSVDSTNLNGTAPASYAPDSPSSNANGVMNGAYDTGIRANNGQPADSLRNNVPPAH
ncbi:hypothetical protein ACTHGU_02795 [Chitinophagaceae bacterium MMS25-I14]